MIEFRWYKASLHAPAELQYRRGSEYPWKPVPTYIGKS